MIRSLRLLPPPTDQSKATTSDTTVNDTTTSETRGQLAGDEFRHWASHIAAREHVRLERLDNSKQVAEMRTLLETDDDRALPGSRRSVPARDDGEPGDGRRCGGRDDEADGGADT